MTARMKLIAVALAGALTTGVAGIALAHGGPGMGPHGGRMEGRGPQAEQMGQRLAALKAALNLQPNQMAAWDAFEAKVAANQQARSKLREAMPARGDRDAMADFRVQMLKFNAQAADEANQARKALVGLLSAEQKQVYDNFRPGPGPMAGQRGEGRGPGHRHGGPGGCVGAPATT
jgi:hypothetical protein